LISLRKLVKKYLVIQPSLLENDLDLNYNTHALAVAISIAHGVTGRRMTKGCIQQLAGVLLALNGCDIGYQN